MSNLIEVQAFEIPGFSVSWVGEHPETHAIWLGGEDGRLGSLADLGPGGESHFGAIKLVEDPVNGVAFSSDRIAVTSRNQILIANRDPKIEGQFRLQANPYGGGAHCVIDSGQGTFLAPIGVDGLLVLGKGARGEVVASIIQHPDGSLNFYRIIRLGDVRTGPAFACAGRYDGLLVGRLAGGTLADEGIVHRFEGQDIVDVCSLNDPSRPFAVACVSKDRRIFVFDNVLDDTEPEAFELDGPEGTAYTILASRGLFFLLTSEAFHAFRNPGSGEDHRSDTSGPANFLTIPCEAAEAYLIAGRSVVLLEEPQTTRWPVADFVALLEAEDDSLLMGPRISGRAHAEDRNGWPESPATSTVGLELALAWSTEVRDATPSLGQISRPIPDWTTTSMMSPMSSIG